MEDISSFILRHIPQQAPFRFVDSILSVNEEEIQGSYLFDEQHDFYKGHFLMIRLRQGSS